MKKTTKDTQVQKAKIGGELNFAAREAYNLLKTNVMFSFPDKEGGKIIGISSSYPKEGKSTTAINLAYSLGEAGYSVLLIDGDLRLPSIYKYLEIEMSPGLSNYISGEEVPNIHKGILGDKVDVITSGDIPPNPSILISSKRMNDVLADFQNSYDYIIFDLPPVLSVSDAVAVSKYIDGIVLVVRHDYTRTKDVMDVVRQLEFAGAKILGFVYNRSTHRKTRRYKQSKK